MAKKGAVKMGLADFLGPKAANASQSVKGHMLPSGPDPNRDPDERRGPGGRRFDDDYDGPGARADGADQWRRGPGAGGGGMEERRGGGYDHERGSMAPEDGTWRSRAPPPRQQGGGGFDRDGGGGGGNRMGGGGGFGGDRDRDGGGRMGGGGFDERRSGPGRDSGYDNPPPSTSERPRLQLKGRTLALPEKPAVVVAAEKKTPAPAAKPKPSGPRSNPFGAASAVDTTQRDLEIEAKAEAARQTSLRRRDETIRSSKPATAAVDDAAGGDDGEGGDASVVQSEAPSAAEEEGGSGSPTTVVVGDGDGGGRKGEDAAGGGSPIAPKAEPAKPLGRWAALRREGGGVEDRAPPAQRRDRDDDRRGGGGGGFDGRGGGGRDERSSFGRRNDGDAAGGGGGAGGGFGGGGRMEREPFQPPAPPAGNAFAKRFGSNDRETDRSFPRPRAGGMGGGGFERNNDDRRGGMGGGMGMGGGSDRWDDDRRGSGGGYDRRDDGRGMDRRDDGRGMDRRDDGRGGSGGGGGAGMSMGGSRFRREDDGGSQRRYDSGTAERRPALNIRPAGSGSAGATSSPPSSLSKMSMKGTNQAAPAVKAELAAVPGPEPEVEPTPEPEPEPEPEEPKEDPAEVARLSAAEALASGKRGGELKEFVMTQEKRTTAGALLAAVLEGTETPQDMKWSEKGEFGPALLELSKGSTEQQMGMIYAAVAKCNAMGFPKEAGGGVVQTMFMGMYNCDLCEEEAFIEWKDDVDNPAEGRMKAVLQTTPWFLWLEEVDEEDDEEA